MFIRQFLTLNAHARTVSQSHWQSLFTFNSISVIIALWRSHILLLHGHSAGVAFILILKFSQKSMASFETNSPPLSL